MSEYKISFAGGLLETNKTKPVNDNFALKLTNFLPTRTGLKLRKGHKTIVSEGVDYIAPYVYANRLILFSRQYGILGLDAVDRYTVLLESEKSIPIFHLETNSRLLLFYENETVKELFNNGENFILNEVFFNDGLGRVFYKAVGYRSRVFFIEKNNTILHYTGPGAYKGDLGEYDAKGVFNSTGNVVSIENLGYSAGAGVQSNLAVIFEGGDILIFDGKNPESETGDWKAIAKISLNTACYAETFNYGTKLYVSTKLGLVDIGIVLSQDNIVTARALTVNLEEADIDYSNMNICQYQEYVLFNDKTKSYQFLFHSELGIFSKIDGYRISKIVTYNNNLYFVSQNKLVKAFCDYGDDDNPVVGDILTNWLDFSTLNNKRVNFVSLGLYYSEGSYDISCGVGSDFQLQSLNKAQLPKFLGNSVRWRDIPTWAEAGKLWQGATVTSFANQKFSKGAMGKYIACRINIKSSDIVDLEIQNLTIIYDIFNN